jgi:hypothetical protein
MRFAGGLLGGIVAARHRRAGCTAIDRFHERVPDLSVSDVLAALGEVGMALRCPGGPKRSRSNVVRISDYKQGSI